jgi:hypothetical protein
MHPGASDRFGFSVAASDDTVIVGAYGEASSASGVNGDQTDTGSAYSGAAYVFVRAGTSWTQQAYLKASNTGFSDQFGYSVAVSGNTVVVGAYGEDSSATLVNGDELNDAALDSGAAYVFGRSGMTWSQQAYLKASNTGHHDSFGWSVAVFGDTVVVGAPDESSEATGINGEQTNDLSSGAGAAYVFVRSEATWTQQAYLKASNTAPGSGFGGSVAVSGDVVIVGSSAEDSSATGTDGDQANNDSEASGAAYVFARSLSTWSQRNYLKASNTDAVDRFGYSVSMSDGTIVVGAIYEDSGVSGVNGDDSNNDSPSAGAMYVFVPDAVTNGGFSDGLDGWSTYATPNPSYMTAQVTGGVLRIQRLPPPVGTANQATVFHETGLALAGAVPVSAHFDLGNDGPTTRRISVLILDSDFSDFAVCTFWLPANAPLRTYGMRTHSTHAWSNAAIYFYAATAGTDGAYLIDNVSLSDTPDGDPTTTMCLDPVPPSAPGGAAGPNLLVNGDFASGTVAPGWSTFGQMASQVVGGVFEFVKNPGTPSGVALQATGQAMTAGQILTSTFELGNSSGVRKRVTAILHDNNFSDLSACTFWLEPGQPLSAYTYRTYATQSWMNATLSIYPATVGADQWIRLDNVTLQRTPGATIVGTECLEPGSSPDAPSDARLVSTSPMGPVMAILGVIETTFGPRGSQRQTLAPDSAMSRLDYWIVDGFQPVGDWLAGPSWIATADESRNSTLEMSDPLDLALAHSAHLRFDSTLRAGSSTASVEISVEGGPWEAAAAIAPSGTRSAVDIDLSSYLGRVIHLRFVFTPSAPSADLLDAWRIDDLNFDVDVAAR